MMQEKSKLLIAISLIIISSLLLFNYITYQPVEPTGSPYCDEWYETFKIGTTIEYLHFHRCVKGEPVTVEGWSPSQDFKDDPSWYGPVTRTATSSDFNFYFGEKLTEAGRYRFDWEIGGSVSGSGHGFVSEKYKTRLGYAAFTLPESVNSGEELTASYSIKNTGELTGQLTISVFDGRYGTGNEIHREEGEWLGLGQTYSNSFRVNADSLIRYGDIIYMNLYAKLEGENPGYPDTWVDLRYTTSVEDKIINYTIPTYTLTVNTNPNNCDVRVGQNTINSGTTGIATFTGLQSGTYTVNVSKANYTTTESTININKDTSIYIVLEKIPEPEPEEPPISTPPVTPGFETLTLIISLIITFILLRKKRKKNEK